MFFKKQTNKQQQKTKKQTTHFWLQTSETDRQKAKAEFSKEDLKLNGDVTLGTSQSMWLEKVLKFELKQGIAAPI